MSTWKWNVAEAISIVTKSYIDDWGRGADRRYQFVSNPKIIEFEDGEITGLASGEGQPVIFIHGSPGNAMRWAQYVQNPPAAYQFISVDRMGYGMRKNDEPDLEEDTAHLKDFIDSFDNPIIVGHSLGGALALRLTAQSTQIKGLVLIGASVDPNLERVMPIQKWGAQKYVRKGLSHSIRHSNLEMLQLIDYMKKTESLLRDLSIGVEIIHAQNDGLVSPENINYIQKFAPQANVISPETGGHDLPWQREDIILGAIDRLSA